MPRLPPIAVEHDAGCVPRAVLNPGLRTPRCERERDERRSQVVDADGAAKWRALEQLASINASQPEMGAEHAGSLGGPRRQRTRKHKCIRLGFATECGESRHDAFIEHPCAGVARLRPLQPNRSMPEIQVAPLQVNRFTRPQTLASKEAIE
jgi:hypothetical protein